jgi:hypothetical protein
MVVLAKFLLFVWLIKIFVLCSGVQRAETVRNSQLFMLLWPNKFRVMENNIANASSITSGNLIQLSRYELEGNFSCMVK